MPDHQSRLVMLFACLGHFFTHLLLALFATVVLALEEVWSLPYDRLIGLWTLGAFLLGAGAPLAGWLSDRWGETKMMVVFFLAIGLATASAGLTSGPASLTAALAGLGLAGSIFHPVAMAWVMKNVRGRGKALGTLGIFGSIGQALSGVLAGGLIVLIDWRAAFILPGLAATLTGLALFWCLARGHLAERQSDLAPQAPDSRQDMVRAFVVMSATLFLGWVFYAALTTVLPKWFSEGLPELLAAEGDGAPQGLLGVGAAVTLAYLIASSAQLIAGYLADRFPLKPLYLIGLGLKLPLLFLARDLGGIEMLLAATAILFFMDLTAPVENLLIARYAPQRRRGLVYGAKHILAFIGTPLGVTLVALSYDSHGGTPFLLLLLAGLVALMLLAACFLPGGKAQAPRPLASQGSPSA